MRSAPIDLPVPLESVRPPIEWAHDQARARVVPPRPRGRSGPSSETDPALFLRVTERERPGEDTAPGLPRLLPGRYGLSRRFLARKPRDRLTAGMTAAVAELDFCEATIVQIAAAAGFHFAIENALAELSEGMPPPPAVRAPRGRCSSPWSTASRPSSSARSRWEKASGSPAPRPAPVHPRPLPRLRGGAPGREPGHLAAPPSRLAVSVAAGLAVASHTAGATTPLPPRAAHT